MTVDRFKLFNKSILFRLAGLDKLRCNAFFFPPAGEKKGRSSLPRRAVTPLVFEGDHLAAPMF
jgi:hypothetical protein